MHDSQLLRHTRWLIGQNIHSLRVRRRLTLHKLARLTEINAARLDQFELGKNRIALEEMLRIARALHVEMRALLPGE